MQNHIFILATLACCVSLQGFTMDYDSVGCTLYDGAECDGLVQMFDGDTCCANVTVVSPDGTITESDICYSFLLYTQNPTYFLEDGTWVNIQCTTMVETPMFPQCSMLDEDDCEIYSDTCCAQRTWTSSATGETQYLSTASCVPTAYLPYTFNVNTDVDAVAGSLVIDCFDYSIFESGSIYIKSITLSVFLALLNFY